MALVWVFVAPRADAKPATYAGASADGSVVLFTTSEKVVSGDTDNALDVYVRSFDDSLGSYVTREISTGPTGGNDAFSASFDDVSSDGLSVFFSTDESLVSGDKDRSEDVYVRELSTGTTKLVSRGEDDCAPCGDGPADATFVGASATGDRVFFVSSEPLAQADGDDAFDVYVRELGPGETTLVSVPAASCPDCGNGANGAVFQGASSDGSVAVFSTAESLAGEDGDEAEDIYARDVVGEATSLVSTAGSCPTESCPPTFGGVSANGAHVLFETNDRIADGVDLDSSSDVYDWSGGTPVLVSTGPQGPNGIPDAVFDGTSANGGVVAFSTTEALVDEDTDSTTDVYLRSGGETTLVSTGPAATGLPQPAAFHRLSADGTGVVFNTAEPLTDGDLDHRQDVYERSGATTTLLSTGPAGGNGAFDAAFAGLSADGQHVLFDTAEPLASQDTDTSSDIYERHGGTTAWVSTGQIGQSGSFDPSFTGVSDAGEHALFITSERLAVDDLDTENDVYDRSDTGTLLVSTGNSIALGPATPALTGTTPPSPNPSLTPALLGQAEADTSIKVYATTDCSGAPIATGTAAELDGDGIPLAVAAGSTTTFRVTATDENGDTSACSSDTVTYQVSAGDGSQGGGGEQGGGDSGGGGGATPGGGRAGAPQVGGAGGTGGRSGESHVVPRTRITFAPAFRTRSRRPVFRFADVTGQLGTLFFCKVDRKRWRRCRSPRRLRRLKRGRHVFRVIGSNSGLTPRRPVVRRFKVVRR
jgi:hypothetical protein